MLTAEAEQSVAPNGASFDSEPASSPIAPIAPSAGETAMLQMLLAQLAEKDRQLAAKDAQIEKLIVKGGRTRPEFIDVGWAAFNVEAIEGVGIWAEQNGPDEEPDPAVPRLRVFGESFTIAHEVLWMLYRELGLQVEPSPTHDKYAAIVNDASCLNRASISEPIFILRAQDQFAAQLVRMWADLAEQAGCGPEKLEDARAIAQQMDEWSYHKIPD